MDDFPKRVAAAAVLGKMIEAVRALGVKVAALRQAAEDIDLPLKNGATHGRKNARRCRRALR